MTSDAITAAQHSFNNQRTIELFIGIESSKSLSSIIAALFFLFLRFILEVKRTKALERFLTHELIISIHKRASVHRNTNWH